MKKPKLLLLLALFLGWLTNWLFYGKAVGVSLPIFVMALLAALALATVGDERPFRWRNLVIIGPLFFFAVMGMVRANEFLTFLNINATLALLSLLAYFYTADSLTRPGLVEFAVLPLRVLGGMMTRPLPLVRQEVDFEAVRKHTGGNVAPVVRGVVIAAPVLLVFGLLLASADVIFANTLRNVFLFDWGFNLYELAWRGILIIGAGWLLAGGLLYSLRHDTAVKASWPEKVMLTLSEKLPLGIIEAVTVLSLINGLFAAFVAIQFVYLFGGQQNIAFEKMTYSEYARRGFFELIVVAVLTLALILVLNWFTGRRSRRQMVTFNGLCTLMIGFVLVMLVSAFKRMSLYEVIYGFTELRLYVYVFMACLALVLLWFALTLWARPDRFAIGVLVAAFGFVVALNLINPDAFIVRQNLIRYERLGYLDVEYLGTLSADAVPELIRVATAVADDQTITAADYYSRIDIGEDRSGSYTCLETTEPNYLENNLAQRLETLQNELESSSWPSWHYGRSQAYNLLAQTSLLP
ncbi:MAG: DUF4173 domain-containing protein [Anaerolineales bacterium]|nr:DUF4173 domain-containing protein [Anaerolineales bacterium]